MTRCFRVVDLRVSIFILLFFFQLPSTFLCKSVSFLTSFLTSTSDNCHTVLSRFSRIYHPGRLVWATLIYAISGRCVFFLVLRHSGCAPNSMLIWCPQSPCRNTMVLSLVKQRMVSTAT